MSKKKKAGTPPETKSASVVLQEFIDELHKIDGMAPSEASIIQRLWNENRLGSEELLAALETEREKRDSVAKKGD